MNVEKLDIVRFAPKGKENFYDAVIESVSKYFETNNISPYANGAMWVKTAFMLLLYFVPYFFMASGVGSGNIALYFLFWFLMGMGMSGIGTSVMHDANHGTYSPNKNVNNLISRILDIIGGYTVTWRIQHNVLHHTYTNIDGLDEDIRGTALLRLAPTQPRYWFHKYQHLYAWILYSITTLYWMTAKDYMQAIRYKRHDLLVKQKVSFKQALLRISLFKAFYYAYMIAIPILFSGVPWYFIVLGFCLMHGTAGLFLTCVFQPAHVMEASPFLMPVETEGKRRMENSWAIHEVINTTNFAPNSRILSWFIGGLNYQIEHHLFTRICHIHYPKLAPIVRSAIASFGLPYNSQPTFTRALLEHAKMLKKLGEME